MKTGEGKTLVATLPVYLNALAGKGVHVVTVNDYLAKRDAEWMGPITDIWDSPLVIFKTTWNKKKGKRCIKRTLLTERTLNSALII